MSEQHVVQWQQIQSMFIQNRFAPALFLVGPQHAGINEFTYKVVQLFFCKKVYDNMPCLACPECLMVQHTEHPDMVWIKPESNSSVIKIDQIRSLQQSAFLTPQRAPYKVIVIEQAEKMNTASFNALLKTLEEPAAHVHFILIGEQIGTVAPTVLSRCQLLRFDSLLQVDQAVLDLGLLYPESSQRHILVQQAEKYINDLIHLIEKKQHPCVIAAQWNQLELENILWFLYLLLTQLCYSNIQEIPKHSTLNQSLCQLKSLLPPVKIFEQLDLINAMLKKISHNININSLLVLEEWLFALYNA